MKKTIHASIENKQVTIHLTARAVKQLHRTSHPTYIGLELYFSCLVKKIIVAFDHKPERNVEKITDKLFIYFRPVQSKACNIHDLIGTNSPTLIDFSVIKRRALIPQQIRLDYHHNKWIGDFTWKRPDRKSKITNSNQKSDKQVQTLEKVH